MLLFYLRHGEPIYDPDSLTPTGHLQAQALSKRLALYGLDKIYASSSNRAKQTAQPTCDLLGKEMNILDWCNEGHAWGAFKTETGDGGHSWAWINKKYRELFVSDELRTYGDKWYDHPFLAERNWGETVEKYRDNTDAFMQSLGYRHDREKNYYIAERENEDRVALFAHQGFFSVFMSCLLDISLPEFGARFDMGHSGMTVIQMKERGGIVIPRVMQVSNDSHIYKEGLTTCYNNEILF